MTTDSYIRGQYLELIIVEKIFSDLNEIWCVCRGRWVMHDGMQYDPIQGQGQGHEPLNVGNSTIFEGYLHSHL